MTYNRYLTVPVIRTLDSFMERVDYVRVTFTFRDLAVIPKQIITGSWATLESMMWAALGWGLPPEQFAMLDDTPMSVVREQLSWWEQQSGITLGEIAAVARTAQQHASELEFDLITQAGLRLRNCPSEDFTWRDLLVLVKHARSDWRVFGAAHPDAADWDLTNQLLATMADTLHWLQWAKTDAAQDPDSMPDMIPRPGVPEKPKQQSLEKKAGKPGKGMPLDRAKEVFARATTTEEDSERSAKLYSLFRQ